MPQRRINTKLLIILIVVIIAGAAGAYGLRKFQINRNAPSFRDRAHEAIEEGDLRVGRKLLGNYLAYRPDDKNVRAEFANLCLDITELPDADGEDYGIALKVAPDSVRKLPNNNQLRERLAKYMMKFGRWSDATRHLEHLIKQYPENTEYQVDKMRCLVGNQKIEGNKGAIAFGYELVGYNETTKIFDPEKGKATDQTESYWLLYKVLHRFRNDDDTEEAIVDQMLEVNPDDFQSHLNRGIYLRGRASQAKFKGKVALAEAEDAKITGDQRLAQTKGKEADELAELAQAKRDEAKNDIDAAARLAPDEYSVAISAAELAMDDEDVDRAREKLDRAIQIDPTDARAYQLYSQFERSQGNTDAALAKFDAGIEAAEQPILLLVNKALLQATLGDAAGTRKTKQILTANARGFSELLELIEARALFAEQKWSSAVKVFWKVRPKLAGKPPLAQFVQQVDAYLGRSYEMLGMTDRAIERYAFAAEANPGDLYSKAGEQRMRRKLGRTVIETGPTLQSLTKIEMEKPEGQRNWSGIDALIKKIVADKGFGEARANLVQAEALTLRKEYDKAESLIREASKLDKDEITVWLAAVGLMVRNPDGGAEKALKILDNTIKKFGDTALLRERKAMMLFLIQGEDMQQELDSLTEGIDDWSREQQVSLWKGLARLYVQSRMPEKARICWKQASEISPEDLQARVSLFDDALVRMDETAIVAAQEAILRAVGSKNDSTYQFTEAARLLAMNRAGRADESAVKKARELVEKSLKDRQEWHVLHRLKAQIAIIQGDNDEAIREYQRAAELGPPHPQAVLNHAKLLFTRGRVNDARLVVQQLPKTSRQRMLGRLNAEIMFESGNYDEAIETADMVIENKPSDAGLHLWYGRLLSRINQKKPSEEYRQKAEEMLYKAVQLSPQSTQTHLTWISYLARDDRRADAEQALREAQLVLPSDALILVNAKCNEMLGRWHDAEGFYKTAIVGKPDNLRVVRLLASFYLGPGYRQADRVVKATPLLNQILKAAVDGDIPKDDDDALWARRQAAKLLSINHDYQNLLKAEKLLQANSIGEDLRVEDKLQLATILVPRPEPASRLQAIRLLEDARRNTPLSLTAELSLARLYMQVGRWKQSREHMLYSIGRFGKEPLAWETFTRMLIDHGEYDEAEDMLKQLLKIDKQSPAALELAIRIYSGQGKQDVAAKQLHNMLPGNPKSWGPEQLPRVRGIAKLLDQLGETKAAESLYKQQLEITQKGGDAEQITKAAELLAMHRGIYGDPEEAFEVLETMWAQSRSTLVLRSAINIMRVRRDLLGRSKDELVEGWLDSMLRENPESTSLLMLMSQFRETQQDVSKAETIYRQLLDKPDVVGSGRGLVLNNLAFLLALKNKDLDDAMKFVEEGMHLFGPTADLLDTRAVVKIARKDAKGAVADLELSLTDNPTAAKYFHLAQARHLAGDKRGALDAWNNATKLKLGPDALSNLEHSEYERMESEINRIRIQGTEL